MIAQGLHDPNAISHVFPIPIRTARVSDDSTPLTLGMDDAPAGMSEAEVTVAPHASARENGPAVGGYTCGVGCERL